MELDISFDEYKACRKIHGYISSSDSDSEGDDSRLALDAEYKAFKPPPIQINPNIDKIVKLTHSNDGWLLNEPKKTFADVLKKNLPKNELQTSDEKLSKNQKKKRREGRKDRKTDNTGGKKTSFIYAKSLSKHQKTMMERSKKRQNNGVTDDTNAEDNAKYNEKELCQQNEQKTTNKTFINGKAYSKNKVTKGKRETKATESCTKSQDNRIKEKGEIMANKPSKKKQKPQENSKQNEKPKGPNNKQEPKENLKQDGKPQQKQENRQGLSKTQKRNLNRRLRKNQNKTEDAVVKCENAMVKYENNILQSPTEFERINPVKKPNYQKFLDQCSFAETRHYSYERFLNFMLLAPPALIKHLQDQRHHSINYPRDPPIGLAEVSMESIDTASALSASSRDQTLLFPMIMTEDLVRERRHFYDVYPKDDSDLTFCCPSSLNARLPLSILPASYPDQTQLLPMIVIEDLTRERRHLYDVYSKDDSYLKFWHSYLDARLPQIPPISEAEGLRDCQKYSYYADENFDAWQHFQIEYLEGCPSNSVPSICYETKNEDLYSEVSGVNALDLNDAKNLLKLIWFYFVIRQAFISISYLIIFYFDEVFLICVLIYFSIVFIVKL